jgi:hypothetical protein
MFKWIKELFIRKKYVVEDDLSETLLVKDLYLQISHMRNKINFIIALNEIEIIEATQDYLAVNEEIGDKFKYIKIIEAHLNGFNFAYSSNGRQYWYRKKRTH